MDVLPSPTADRLPSYAIIKVLRGKVYSRLWPAAPNPFPAQGDIIACHDHRPLPAGSWQPHPIHVPILSQHSPRSSRPDQLKKGSGYPDLESGESSEPLNCLFACLSPALGNDFEGRNSLRFIPLCPHVFDLGGAH